MINRIHAYTIGSQFWCYLSYKICPLAFLRLPSLTIKNEVIPAARFVF